MRKKPSKLRKRIDLLIKKRQKAESEILKKEPMVAASFCTRTNDQYYLSASIDGESRHRYIKRDDKKHWQKRCGKWREYSVAIAVWVKISKELEQLLREFGRSRLEAIPERKAKPGEKL